MAKFILGKKLGMTQVFKGEKIIPVTLIKSGPNFVTQVKTNEKDGYAAVQLGFGERKEKNIKKPQRGHLSKMSNVKGQMSNLRWLREFRISSYAKAASFAEVASATKAESADKENPEIKIGDKIDVSIFVEGDKVNVVAISKGKGFQGVVKRHGFGGGPKSHGQKDRHRAPGSIGSSFPEHVFKGMRMAGRMGGDRVTVKNLEVAEVDSENNIIALKGAVPGRRGTLVVIRALSKILC